MSVAEAAIRFKASPSISRRAHRCSRVSLLAGPFLLRPGGRTTRASSPPSRYRFTRSRICAVLESEGSVVALATEIGLYGAELGLLGVAVALPRPVYGPDAALVDPLPPKPRGRLRKAGLALQHGDGPPSAYLSAKRCLNSAE